MSNSCRGHFQRRGLTLAEFLVVISIAAILITLAAQVLQKMRETSSREQCRFNLMQIGTGLHKFEDTLLRLPPLYGGDTNKASINFNHKFPHISGSGELFIVWGSTHVFILPFIEQNTYQLMASEGNPEDYDPRNNNLGGNPPNEFVIPTFVCPSDPSMSEGIIAGNNLGGTSYAANAQVFAPLNSEKNGDQLEPGNPNWCDRGTRVASILDGAPNTILFTHSYAQCGTGNTGTAWGYTEGKNHAPATVLGFQPWSRSSVLKQDYNGTLVSPFTFQNQPNPYNSNKCDARLPATPHFNAMILLMGDASVRSIQPDISVAAWNAACLPNDEGWGNVR